MKLTAPSFQRKHDAISLLRGVVALAPICFLAAPAHAATGAAGEIDAFVFQFSIFVLAIFVGYYVVWSVTPALHTPLMSVTNAISSVIIVGALIAAGPEGVSFSKLMGLVAIALAAVNIFGGFTVTQRMLAMFRKKK